MERHDCSGRMKISQKSSAAPWRVSRFFFAAVSLHSEYIEVEHLIVRFYVDSLIHASASRFIGHGIFDRVAPIVLPEIDQSLADSSS